jgi:pyruvate,water dikinase
VARVSRTLEEATAILPGEILVAITTMPPWTPLFGIAAAVVTETGGPLSHCAIVAREYGIPAVVGAHGATRVIATRHRITVDGGAGIVTLEA